MKESIREGAFLIVKVLYGIFYTTIGWSNGAGLQWYFILIKEGENVLTEQKKLFIEEYLKLRCKNATMAAIYAGYSQKSASAQASQLLKNPEVSDYLKERKEEIKGELQQEFFFDALEARKVMYQILTNEDASDKNKIAVAKDFLDRAGFKVSDKVEVEGNIQTLNPYDELSVEELKNLAKLCEENGKET